MTHLPAEPLEFHRLSRARPRHRWWHGLVVGLVAVAVYVALFLVIAVPVVVFSALDANLALVIQDAGAAALAFDVDNPLAFIALVGPLIMLVPAVWIASRLVQGRGVGFLFSVNAGLRWSWFWRVGIIAAIVYSGQFAVVLAMAAASGEDLRPDFDQPGLPLMLLLVVLLIPLQATAEEFVFRGYLMQVVGGWVKHPAFAIVVPVPLFVLGHGYDVWGQLSVGAFAVVAGWLAWRTGGLEAAIAMHVVNNLGGYLLGSVGLLDINATSVLPVDVVVSVATLLVFAVVTIWWARRCDVARTGPLVSVARGMRRGDAGT